MKWRSAIASRWLLLIGYLMFLWLPWEVYSTPILTSLVAPRLGENALTKECYNSFTRCECNYNSLLFTPQAKRDASPCPPCLHDTRCLKCMADNLASNLLLIVMLFAVASVVLLPREKRTMGGYYSRLILMLMAGILLTNVYTIFWGPGLMLTRKWWFRLPSSS